jgi:hypothetical protein
MDNRYTYLPPVPLGAPVRAGVLCEIIQSQRSDVRPGELLFGLGGWEEYFHLSTNNLSHFGKVPRDLPVPLSSLLALAGSSGMSAYFGIHEIARPKAGETMVVTAAAGAAGSLAGQIGKIHGAKVIGVAGGEGKCAWLTGELGFDGAVDYKADDWRARLARHCGRGVDIVFDNTGGQVSDFLMERLNPFARVVLNGLIASYNGEASPQIDATNILMRRARVEGVLATDYSSRYDEAARQLVRWIQEDRLRCRETILDGIESLPQALAMLFDGGNYGKLLVRADRAAVDEIDNRRISPMEICADEQIL